MDVTSTDVAFASVLVTGALGIVTGVNAWRERSNTRTLRSEDRVRIIKMAAEGAVKAPDAAATEKGA